MTDSPQQLPEADDNSDRTAGSAPIPGDGAETAAETPPHADAERMEAALRIGGPLAPVEDEQTATARRERPTEDGPGTSLT